jgi:hypothetical protein
LFVQAAAGLVSDVYFGSAGGHAAHHRRHRPFWRFPPWRSCPTLRSIPYRARRRRVIGDSRQLALDAMIAAGVRFDHARIDGKALAANQTSLHAGAHHVLKNTTEKVALATTSMAVFRKGRMIWNRAFKAKTTEPVIRFPTD